MKTKQSLKTNLVHLLMLFTVVLTGVLSTPTEANAANVVEKGSVVSVQAVGKQTGVLSLYDSNDVSAVSFIGKNDSLVAGIVASVNQNQGVNILKYDAGTGLLTFNNKMYAGLDNSAKESYMSTALEAIRESGMNAQRKNKMYNFVSEQDSTISQAINKFSQNVKADSAGAFALLSPFQKGLGIFLGVILVVTMMMLVFSIIMDLAYLVIPLFAVFADKHTGREGVSTPWYISEAAVHAKKVSENSIGSNNFTNSVVEYARRRTIQVFLIILIAFMLITGSIYRIVGIIGDSLGL